MAHIIQAYHPTTPLPDTHNELASYYYSVLYNKHAILLFDNAANDEQLTPLIPPSSCLMLITSRRRIILPGIKAINMAELSANDAEQLLLRIAPRIGNYASTLANLCGYLPLALSLAGSALAKYVDLAVIDYVKRLTDAKQRLKLIDASFSLSYDLLEPDMQQRWSMLAIFPDSFDRSAATAVWNIDPDLAQETLSELVAYSLVEWNPNAARYHLHELTRIFVGSRLNETNRFQSHKQHAKYYFELLTQANQLYRQGNDTIEQGLQLFDLEWKNIQEDKNWVAANFEIAEEIAQWCNLYPDRGRHILGLRLHPQYHLEWLESGLKASRYLNNRLGEGSHLNNIGAAYNQLGEFAKGIDFLEQALEIAYEQNDTNNIVGILVNIANMFVAMGDIPQAMKLYKQAGDMQEDITNPEMVLVFFSGLSGVHFKTGNIQEALEIDRQSLELVHKMGYWHLEGDILNSLGNDYANLGDLEKALTYYNKAWQLAQKFKDQQLETLAIYSISLIYIQLDKSEQSVGLLQQALEVAQKIGNKQRESEILGKLGLAYLMLNKRNQAIIWLEKSMDIAREIGDQNNQAFLGLVLGEAYRLSDIKKHQAEAVMQMAVDYYRRIGHVEAENKANFVRTRESEIEIDFLIQAGINAIKLNQYDYAMGYYKQALILARQLNNRKKECKVLSLIGTVFLLHDKPQRATKYLNQSLAIAIEINDQEMITMVNWKVGTIGRKEKLTVEMLDTLQQKMDYMKESEHPRTEEFITHLKRMRLEYAESCIEKGKDYFESRQFDKAIDAFTESLNNFRQIDDQQGEIIALLGLSPIYLQTRQKDKFIECSKQIISLAQITGNNELESYMKQALDKFS